MGDINRSSAKQIALGLKAEALLGQGVRLKDIAKKFKVSPGSIQNWRKKAKESPSPGPRAKYKKRDKKPRATSYETFAEEHSIPTTLPLAKSRDKIIVIETDNAENFFAKIFGS